MKRLLILGPGVSISGVLAVLLALTGCQRSKQNAVPAAVASTQKTYVEFEGPWAFTADPNDASTVIAIAPKTKGHHNLFVKASNSAVFEAGMYNLALPARGAQGPGTPDPLMVAAKTDAASFQHALQNKGGRYAIRLPKPDSYAVAGRFKAGVGLNYPPTTEVEYATEISLIYEVNSLSGFSVSGTSDSGAFSPLLLTVDTPLIRFAIEPSEFDDPTDPCNLHSRASFHDLTKLLNLKLYIDFPNDPPECREKDPQNMSPARRGATAETGASPYMRKQARTEQASTGNISGTLPRSTSTMLRGRVRMQPTADSVFWFAHPVANCKAPVLNLTIGP